MSLEANSPRLTFAHEWGHYLDNWLAGFIGYATVETQTMAPLLHTAAQTIAFAGLQQIVSSAGTKLPARMEALRLLVPQEIWARAYAQYIALRSQDRTLSAEIVLRRADPTALLAWLEYWSEDDFTPVAHEIDLILERRGWR
jgi:hypothetical protein